MIKTHRIETEETFDKDGKLVKRIITETNETDDESVKYVPYYCPTSPITPVVPPCPTWTFDSKTADKSIDISPNITCGVPNAVSH